MDSSSLANLVSVIADLFMWFIVASVILSYFLSPYHPVRQVLDRILEPFLAPIRRILPNAGMFDMSSMILILAVWLIKLLLIKLLNPL